MKRHLQKTGVRKFFGQDLIDLQAEPLKALDGFFAEYGACVIMGCEITPAENDTFAVAPGLVAIQATDPETDITAIKVMPFDGAAGVVLPLYLTAQSEVVERVYGDGKVKSIAYDYHAVAWGVEPETPHIVLTATGGNRFADVLQDDSHSFITAQERNKWNAILQSAKEYADATATTKSEAMLRASKEYTDGKDSAVRRDMATADTATLRSAKDYADTIVAALVDNTPEALNTLQELATALGNNPNFATDVLQAIGERATMAQVNAALEGKANVSEVNTALSGKANTSHSHAAADVANVWHSGNFNPDDKATSQKNMTSLNLDYPIHNSFQISDGPFGTIQNAPVNTQNIQVITCGSSDVRFFQIAKAWDNADLFWRGSNSHPNVNVGWYKFYHSGNLTPQTIRAMGLYDSANANTITNTGCYALQTGTANLPFGVGAGDSLLSLVWDSNAANQIITEYDRDKMWMRRKITGVWQPWVEMYHSGNMQFGVIGGGRVYANGGSSDYGRIISAAGTGVQGQYRIIHNLGHTDYSLTGNVFYGDIAAFLMILTKGANDIVVEVRDVQSHPQNLDFMYTISGRL